MEREYLDYSIKKMKRLKDLSIRRAKVNIANAQIRQKRNYDKRFQNKENFNLGDLVLLKDQVNKNRIGRKRANRYSGPYTIIDISKLGNCTLKHSEGSIKKTKDPLAHLKLYHERNLVIDSGNEETEKEKEELGSIEEISKEKIDGSFGTEEGRRVENMKEGCFVEDVMGLVIKDKYKRKRKKREMNVKRKSEITYVDLSSCTVTQDDTLPDLDREIFTGAQYEYGFNEMRSATDGVRTDTHTIGAQFTGNTEKDVVFMGASERDTQVTSAHITSTLHGSNNIVRGDPHTKIRDGKDSVTSTHGIHEHEQFTGTHRRKEILVTGAQFTGAPDSGIEVTGAQFIGALKSSTPITDRITKARRRLSLSLNRNRVPENSMRKDEKEKPAVKTELDLEFVDDLIFIDSSPCPSSSSLGNSVQILSPDDNSGIVAGKYVFIPIGPESHLKLVWLFGINYMGPMPKYSGIMKTCQGMPKRIHEITGKW